MIAKLPPPDEYDDNPEWTEEDFAKARPMTDFPELAAAVSSLTRPKIITVTPGQLAAIFDWPRRFPMTDQSAPDDQN